MSRQSTEDTILDLIFTTGGYDGRVDEEVQEAQALTRRVMRVVDRHATSMRLAGVQAAIDHLVKVELLSEDEGETLRGRLSATPRSRSSVITAAMRADVIDNALRRPDLELNAEAMGVDPRDEFGDGDPNDAVRGATDAELAEALINPPGEYEPKDAWDGVLSRRKEHFGD